jgi:methionyl aminopeptidase
MITRKSREQIALMRRAGRVVAEMHEECIRASKPGATTLDVDAVAREVLDRRGARSNFLNYHGFPAVVCTSPNDVIVHGIPSADVVLEEGDIFSIDCGAIIEGWHGDAAVTIPIGEVDDESKRLIEVTRASLEAAIEQVVEGHRLGDIGAAVEGLAEAAGFTVVREYVGHGIGTAMHEEPQVPNYGPAGRGLRLKEGHVLAIEPMVNAGGPETEVLADGWTVRTRDGRRSAHFEHTIAVTDDGPEVLTLPW